MNSSIAYITTTFPKISHTFIYKEVLGLRKRGVNIRTFSIRRVEIDSLSKESLDLYYSTTFLLPPNIYKLLMAHLYFMGRYPLRYLWVVLFLMTRKYNKQIQDRKRTFFHFGEAVYFAKLIKEDGSIKHVHAHYVSHPATLAMIASMLLKIPFSFTAHATDIWEDKLFIKEKVNAAKFVVTCSEYGRSAIVKLEGIEEPEKITTIYHGVDVGTFKRSGRLVEKSRPTILNVGRLFHHKAQDKLIMACKLLKDEGVDFQCKIGGDGPLRSYLEDLIVQNGLEQDVKLVGAILQEDIRDYYEEADLFALSSVSENLPNVLLESLAMGLPVVATSIAGVPELIKDKITGILVKPGDSQELAGAIKLLMKDRRLARVFSENGRRAVCRDFDAEKCLDELVELYCSNGLVGQ